MRIGIDARELCGHPTGVGRYLSGLVTEWAATEPARRHEFVLYAHQPIAIAIDARHFSTRVVAGRGGTRWEQWQLPRAFDGDRLDVWFAPAYTAPLLTRLPVVLSVHDVSFAAHPEWFAAREGLRRRWLTARAAAAARAITTLSEFSKREIVEHLGVPESRIHIIRPGVKAVVPLDHLDAAGIPPRVLFVGSIFNRRHVPDLIRAFGRLAASRADVRLDLVGDNRTYPREDIEAAIRRERAADRITWHSFLPDAGLAGLYQTSRAFAFLSEYEGLGLTPLEALAAGVPSVLLDTPIARESCGAAALYAAPGDIGAIASLLETLLFNEPARRRVLDEAPAVLQKYDWADAARATLSTIEAVA